MASIKRTLVLSILHLHPDDRRALRRADSGGLWNDCDRDEWLSAWESTQYGWARRIGVLILADAGAPDYATWERTALDPVRRLAWRNGCTRVEFDRDEDPTDSLTLYPED